MSLVRTMRGIWTRRSRLGWREGVRPRLILDAQSDSLQDAVCKESQYQIQSRKDMCLQLWDAGECQPEEVL
jgi:hypothetical protein